MDEKALWDIWCAVKSSFEFFYMHLCKITFSGWGGGAGDWKGEKGEPLSSSLRGHFFPALKVMFLNCFLFTYITLTVELRIFYGNTFKFVLTQIWLFSFKPLQLIFWFVCYKAVNNSFLTMILWSTTIGKKNCSF